jgi:hypothetical protein
MNDLLGVEGVVVSTDTFLLAPGDHGYYVVEIAGLKWAFREVWLTPVFRPGDRVQVCAQPPVDAQWSRGMNQTCGKIGVVTDSSPVVGYVYVRTDDDVRLYSCCHLTWLPPQDEKQDDQAAATTPAVAPAAHADLPAGGLQLRQRVRVVRRPSGGPKSPEWESFSESSVGRQGEIRALSVSEPYEGTEYYYSVTVLLDTLPGENGPCYALYAPEDLIPLDWPILEAILVEEEEKTLEPNDKQHSVETYSYSLGSPEFTAANINLEDEAAEILKTAAETSSGRLRERLAWLEQELQRHLEQDDLHKAFRACGQPGTSDGMARMEKRVSELQARLEALEALL